jgi:hypothetical protein
MICLAQMYRAQREILPVCVYPGNRPECRAASVVAKLKIFRTAMPAGIGETITELT